MEDEQAWQEPRFENDCGYCKGLFNPDVICQVCWDNLEKEEGNLDG